MFVSFLSESLRDVDGFLEDNSAIVFPVRLISSSLPLPPVRLRRDVIELPEDEFFYYE